MIITLKNVKYSEFASEETLCFQATVYVDGKRFCTARNNGHGGCDDYYPIDGNYDDFRKEMARVEAELAKQIDSEYYSLLEIEVGECMESWLREKELKKILRKVSYIRDGSLYQLKAAWKNFCGHDIRQQKWWKHDNILLNTMPIAEVRDELNKINFWSN